jgi:ribosome biogenesis GTPase
LNLLLYYKKNLKIEKKGSREKGFIIEPVIGQENFCSRQERNFQEQSDREKANIKIFIHLIRYFHFMNNHRETESSGHNSVHSDADTIPGWNKKLELAFSAYKGSYIPGRVASRHKTVCEVLIPGAVVQAGISGALQKIGKQPAVGDYVVLFDQPELGSRMIVNVLPRRTCLSRGAAGNEGEEQVIAANLDTIFIVTAVGKDLNLKRLERYLAIVYSSGARPVILLNKSGLKRKDSRK